MRQLRIALAPIVAMASLAALSAPAVAAGAAPPTVTTAPATAVGSSTATLNGVVNPNGQATQYALQWGPSSGYGHETPLVSAGSGTGQLAVSAPLSALKSGSTIHFRIIAFSSAGTSVGGDLTLSTSGTAPASSPSPTASTASASSLSASTARVSGSVDPKGQATQYVFEYGTTSDYGIQTPPVGAGGGSATISASANLSGLSPSTTYHYRVVAYSVGGTALGSDRTFSTMTPPSVQTGLTSGVDSSSATVSGLVNPMGHSTSYQFQFGTTPFLGLNTPPAGVGSLPGEVAVHQSLTGLAPGTTYYYRVTATSSGGTTYGLERSFQTSGGPSANSKLALLARLGFVAPGSGTVGIGIGCFGGQTGCNGHLSLTVGHTVYAQRDFRLGANSGGFVHTSISRGGQRVLFRHYHGPVKIRLNVMIANGQRLSQVIQLARWY